MSGASTISSKVESNCSRAPSAEPPALQDAECLPKDVAETEQAAAPKSPPGRRYRSHNLAPNFSCVCCVCGACYDTQWELKRHTEHVHPQPSPVAYVCAHCSRGFISFCRLARHLAAVTARVAERRGGTATDETRWPGRTDIGSRLNEVMAARRAARRQQFQRLGGQDRQGIE